MVFIHKQADLCLAFHVVLLVEGKSEGELRREKDEKGESGTSAGGDGAESSHLQDICHWSWVCPGGAALLSSQLQKQFILLGSYLL